MYRHGLIGNCQVSALVGADGSLDWLSMPRPDSPPLLGRILDADGGIFSIEPENGVVRSSQRYLPNTNVLETYVEAADGAFTIVDFCPRFEQYGRMYRPPALFRIVRPTRGAPRVRVRFRPVEGWSKKPAARERGNSHLRCQVGADTARLTTNLSLTHVCDETPFSLQENGYLALTWSHGIEDDLVRVSEQFLARTVQYWQGWVKHCSIPTRFQQETIRSALALKLHCYEDTGAILASPSTSLPEYPNEVRNWDYRFCWLRDAYYTLSAFHQLGHFEEMEGFLKYLLGLVRSGEPLSPVYTVDGRLPLPELEHDAWSGFAASKPVRSGNLAASQVQNDIYGELILALAPIYVDERFEHLRTPHHGELLAELGKRCAATIGEVDAGLWELRGRAQEHSFTNLMCWAGMKRLLTIVTAKTCPALDRYAGEFVAAERKARARLEAAVVDGSLRNGPTDPTHNAALLQMAVLRYPDDAVVRKTVEAIAEDLCFAADTDDRYFLFRYRCEDDFGKPSIPFVFCAFWYVQALARLGHKTQALTALQSLSRAGNELGLFAEHYDPKTNKQWGNFPQAYSHTGQILSAFAASPPWEDVL